MSTLTLGRSDTNISWMLQQSEASSQPDSTHLLQATTPHWRPSGGLASMTWWWGWGYCRCGGWRSRSVMGSRSPAPPDPQRPSSSLAAVEEDRRGPEGSGSPGSLPPPAGCPPGRYPVAARTGQHRADPALTQGPDPSPPVGSWGPRMRRKGSAGSLESGCDTRQE